MQTPKANESDIKPVKPERRYDIDWLRTIAVLLLFTYHTTRIFDDNQDFYIKNAIESANLTRIFIYSVSPWHMPLFFLLAGASTWFALRFRSGRMYTKERFKRLLIPLIFGLLVIVPPQTYIGLRSHSDFAGSFLQYYPNFFSFQFADPEGYFLGGFTVAHLWFIFYLFIFSLVALPFFLYLKGEAGQHLVDMLAAFFLRKGMILLAAVPLIVGSMLLDFYLNPFYYIIFFIYGYILMADARFEEAVDRHRIVALILGPIFYTFVLIPLFALRIITPEGLALDLYKIGFLPLFWLITLLAYGRRFLGFTNRWLKYASEASYPFYTLHQTVIVVMGFYVVQWNAGVAVKFVTIVIGAFAVTTILYDLLVKRTNVTRFLFGLKQR